MTKSELIARLAARFPQLIAKDADYAVKMVIDAMSDALARGDRIEIRGFGSFALNYRPPDPVRAERIGYFTAGGMALGSSLGALIGELMTDDDPSGKWAGFVMGGAAGVVLGILAGSL